MIADAPATLPASEEMDLATLLHVLWNSKVLIVAIALGCAALAAVVAMLSTETYRSEVVITKAESSGMGGVSSLANQFGGLASLAGVNLSAGDKSIEARAVLQSRRLIEEFIKRNDLLPALFPEPQPEPPTLWYGVRLFKQDVVTIREDTRKGVTTVVVEWTDPITAAKWANSFVALANELVRTRTIDESEKNIAYLNDQIARTNIVELQRVMYNLIETETKTLMLAKGREEYAFMVVDPAVAPEVRTSPKRTLMVILGGALGGLLGCLVAVARNIWSRPSRGAVRAH